MNIFLYYYISIFPHYYDKSILFADSYVRVDVGLGSRVAAPGYPKRAADHLDQPPLGRATADLKRSTMALQRQEHGSTPQVYLYTTMYGIVT